MQNVFCSFWTPSLLHMFFHQKSALFEATSDWTVNCSAQSM